MKWRDGVYLWQLFTVLTHFYFDASLICNYTPAARRGRGYTVLPLSVRPSVLPSVQDIFRRIFLCNCWWQKSDIWSQDIFLSNYWWQKSDIWSQASYRYPISWEAFLDPSDSYFLFAEERGYHRWALAHSSSCFYQSSAEFSDSVSELLLTLKEKE